MATLGTFKLGTGIHLGVEELYPYPRMFWRFVIDWDGSGRYSGIETPFVRGYTRSGGRANLVSQDGNGLEALQTTRIDLTVDNHDGRYTADNPSSPYYPYLLPGARAKIRAKDASTGTWYDRWVGSVNDIQPAGSDTVTISLIGDEALLSEPVSIPLQTNIRVSDAIILILQAAGITTYAIDSTLDTLPYWHVTGQTAFTALRELADAYFGRFFFDRSGIATFYKRDRISLAALTLDQSQLGSKPLTKQPWETVKNSITVKVNPLVLQALGVIWTMAERPALNPGASLTTWATFGYNGQTCAATNIVAPVVTTDYTMNTKSDGTGTDLSSQFTVTLSPVYAGKGLVTITNNSASVGIVTMCKVRGQAITKGDVSEQTASTAVSIARYGTRSMTLDSPWIQGIYQAMALAEHINLLLQGASKIPIIQIETRPDLQFQIDQFMRIDLSIAALGISGSYVVGELKEEFLYPNGQGLLTTLTLEPVIDISGDGWFTLPARIGIDTKVL
jgi:hypothetical protein